MREEDSQLTKIVHYSTTPIIVVVRNNTTNHVNAVGVKAATNHVLRDFDSNKKENGDSQIRKTFGRDRNTSRINFPRRKWKERVRKQVKKT